MDRARGFTGSPSCFLPRAQSQPFQGTVLLQNNIAGAATGFYQDTNGALHGMLARP